MWRLSSGRRPPPGWQYIMQRNNEFESFNLQPSIFDYVVLFNPQSLIVLFPSIFNLQSSIVNYVLTLTSWTPDPTLHRLHQMWRYEEEPVRFWKLREPVLFLCETGPCVEVTLHLKYHFSVFSDICCGEIEATEGIKQSIKAWNVSGWSNIAKSRKKTHSGGIDRSSGNLKVLDSSTWPNGLRGSTYRYFQDVCSSCIACRVVSAHGACRVCNSQSFYTARIIGRHCLSLDHRNPFDSKHPPGHRSAAPMMRQAGCPSLPGESDR